MFYFTVQMVYSQSYHEELHTIENCVLVDEFQQNLHSVDDYQAALMHEQQCSPAFGDYLKSFWYLLLEIGLVGIM